MTKYEANGDLKSFLQKQGASYACDATLTSARKIDIAQQIVQGALFLSDQKLVSSSSWILCRHYCCFSRWLQRFWLKHLELVSLSWFLSNFICYSSCSTLGFSKCEWLGKRQPEVTDKCTRTCRILQLCAHTMIYLSISGGYFTFQAVSFQSSSLQWYDVQIDWICPR